VAAAWDLGLYFQGKIMQLYVNSARLHPKLQMQVQKFFKKSFRITAICHLVLVPLMRFPNQGQIAHDPHLWQDAALHFLRR
jgi:hypothetical protein